MTTRQGNRFNWTRGARRSLPWLSCLLLSASASQARHSIQIHPDFKVELFASEPMVVDPVAAAFDEAGRLFVAEMRDYPYGFGEDRKPGGTIRLLEDLDHDGRADRSTVFAKDLSFPTSVAIWNGGVLVAAPPEILFLKDTDGDRVADHREVLFSGFVLGVTDSNFNGLRWGLDNHFHGANGGNGGLISSPRHPALKIPIDNLDFRFDPASGKFEPTFQTSFGFGLVFDEWGRSFTTYNINHIQQRVMPRAAVERSSGLPPIELTTSISDHGEMAPIFPVSTPETRPNHPEQSGHFSSAGGMGFLPPSLFKGELANSILVCDVVGNLVHRDLLRQDGPGFVASRAASEATSEFLASSDGAFRPTGIELGPDGALYLLDMQRDVIEHPDYIPAKLRAKIDLRAGENRGRIYRLVPAEGAATRQEPQISTLDDAGLVVALSSSNPWRRLTAQRLLVERQAVATAGQLRGLLQSGPSPAGRLHALWTLKGLGLLGVGDLRMALRDQDPGMRENAVLASEGMAAELSDRLVELISDPHPRVRFQAVVAAGALSNRAKVLPALMAYLEQDAQWKWSRFAAYGALLDGEERALAELMSHTPYLLGASPTHLEALGEAASILMARAKADAQGGLLDLLDLMSQPGMTPAARKAVAEGAVAGLARTGSKPRLDEGGRRRLAGFLGTMDAGLLGALWDLWQGLELPSHPTLEAALRAALDKSSNPSVPLQNRLAQIRLLRFGTPGQTRAVLLGLLNSEWPAEVQREALAVLRSHRSPETARGIIANWPTLSPALRPQVVNLLLSRTAYHDALVSAVETEAVKLGELNLDLEQRRALLRESAPEIHERASKFIGDEEYGNRAKAVEEWLARLPEKGSLEAGKVVFEARCAQCHIRGGLGHRVGPDLDSIIHRSVEDIVSNIIDPNMALNPSFLSFNADLGDGEIETGILHKESPDEVVLLQAGGISKTIPRRAIKSLRSTGLSLMPAGLELGLEPKDLRDLVAFLQGR